MVNGFKSFNLINRVENKNIKNIQILEKIESLLSYDFKIIDGFEKNNNFYIYVNNDNSNKDKIIEKLKSLNIENLFLYYTTKLIFSPSIDLYENINI